MQDFIFYLKLGFQHVLDPGAYDHILFLAALAIPFTFRSWKKVVVLATVFTVFHCLSLALSAYNLVRVGSSWIEFLIPVTIVLTAAFNFTYLKRDADLRPIYLHLLATAFFGLVHGFGFSNYFNMLMSGEESKNIPLLGFAAGIEVAQVVMILLVLLLLTLLRAVPGLARHRVLAGTSILVILITIPLLVETFPY